MVPFGLIKIESPHWAQEKTKYNQLPFGSANDDDFKVDAAITLIGTNSEGTYIIKNGAIINTNRNYSNRYGSLFQTSFDRVSNLWGSPVLNSKGNVWGMHVISSDTTSYSLKVDYIKNILSQIQANEKIHKGDIGVFLDLIILGIAKSNYKLSDSIAKEIMSNIKNSGGPPEVIIISSIDPNSPSDKLRPGDIIYKVNGKLIANDFLIFDSILNENVGKDIKIAVSRNGEEINFDVRVKNTQDEKILKYLSFASAYFHEITSFVKSYLSSNIDGVYLTYTAQGSPFARISSKNSNSKNNFILTSINSTPIKSIDSLLDFFKTNCDLESIYVEGIDYNTFSARVSSQSIDLDFNSLIQVYTQNPDSFKWEVESLDLIKLCSDNQSTSNVARRMKSDNKDERNVSNIVDEGI
jgi:hypothetical protein